MVPNLTTKFILGTAFIGQFIEKFSLKAGLTIAMSSSPVAIVDKTGRDYVLNIESHDSKVQPAPFVAKQLCIVTLSIILPPMRETIVECNTSVLSIQLAGTHVLTSISSRNDKLWSRKI